MAGCKNDPPYYASHGDGIDMDRARVIHRDSPPERDVVFHASSFRQAQRVAKRLNQLGNGSHKNATIIA